MKRLYSSLCRGIQSTKINSHSTSLRFFSNAFTKSYHLTGLGVKTKTIMTQPHLPSPIITDVPKLMGGKNEGPQPVEMLLASLCGCELVTAQFIARNMKPRVVIDQIDFDVYACRDQRGAIGAIHSLPIQFTDRSGGNGDHDNNHNDRNHNNRNDKESFDITISTTTTTTTPLPPSRLERIWGTAIVHTTASSEEVALIADEVKRRCPIANMVMLSGCKLEIEFIKKT